MLTKKFLKSSDSCSVEFSLSGTIQAETVYLVGDFNNWDETAMSMQRERDGSFGLAIKIAKNREYQFRYLVNGIEWHNDWSADKYVPNSGKPGAGRCGKSDQKRLLDRPSLCQLGLAEGVARNPESPSDHRLAGVARIV